MFLLVMDFHTYDTINSNIGNSIGPIVLLILTMIIIVYFFF